MFVELTTGSDTTKLRHLSMCVDEKLKNFTRQWARLSEWDDHHSDASRNAFAAMLGFENWMDLQVTRQQMEAYDDPRLAFIDMDRDLMGFVDQSFLDHLQLQRQRLAAYMQIQLSSPQTYFGIDYRQQGAVESLVLGSYRVAHNELKSLLPMAFALNNDFPCLAASNEINRHHLWIYHDTTVPFSLQNVLETCTAPGLIVAPLGFLSPVVAERIGNGELAVMQPDGSPYLFSSDHQRDIYDHLLQLISGVHDDPDFQRVAKLFATSMMMRLICASPHGEFDLDIETLGRYMNLRAYHIDALEDVDFRDKITWMSIAAAPAIFLGDEDAEEMRLLVRLICAGHNTITYRQRQRYDVLFQRAMISSQVVRGQMLLNVSAYIPVISPSPYAHSSLKMIESRDLSSLVEYYQLDDNFQGIDTLLDQIRNLEYGSVFIFSICKESSKRVLSWLPQIMEQCDETGVQMIVLTQERMILEKGFKYLRSMSIKGCDVNNLHIEFSETFN